MAISEFQLALIGTGVVAVAAVWGYNAWQEYRIRKSAARTFEGEHDDVLADDASRDMADRDLSAGVGAGGRIEPVFARSATPTADVDPRNDAIESRERDDQASATLNDGAGAIDLAMIDAMIEYSVALPARAGIAALRSTWQSTNRVGHGKSIRWLARVAENGDWIEMGGGGNPVVDDVLVTIQLADRQGAITMDELKMFCHTAESVIAECGGDAGEIDAVALDEVARHALVIDELCASVDIQVAIHIIGRSSQEFPNNKLKGMLEAAGLQLAADGLFYLLDANGNRMLSVCNSGAVPFDLEQMRTGSVGDITFWLDVPRVQDGGRAYDTMVATARQLAEALDGVLVDDQRKPLADNVLSGIRAKVIELQNKMTAHDIPAGGRRALRLFA